MAIKISENIRKQVTLTLSKDDLGKINLFLERQPYASFSGLIRVALMSYLEDQKCFSAKNGEKDEI